MFVENLFRYIFTIPYLNALFVIGVICMTGSKIYDSIRNYNKLHIAIKINFLVKLEHSNVIINVQKSVRLKRMAI